MFKFPGHASAALAGIALLAGCGAAGRSVVTGSPVSFHRAIGSKAPVLTPAKAQRIRSAAEKNALVAEVASGSEIRVSKQVVPSVAIGGRRLIGGVVQVYLTPAVSVIDQRLPAVIYPNEEAPPGTPTLHRHVLLSGSNIGQLEVAISLKRGSAERIEPSGSGSKITKFELIGPPPKNPAYAPEPGR
jgi:hypothetical protein